MCVCVCVCVCACMSACVHGCMWFVCVVCVAVSVCLSVCLYLYGVIISPLLEKIENITVRFLGWGFLMSNSTVVSSFENWILTSNQAHWVILGQAKTALIDQQTPSPSQHTFHCPLKFQMTPPQPSKTKSRRELLSTLKSSYN